MDRPVPASGASPLAEGRGPSGDGRSALASLLVADGRRKRTPVVRRWIPKAAAVMAAAAALLAGAIILWPTLWPSDSRMRIAGVLPKVTLGTDSQAMIGATYAGVDESGRPFTIDADMVRSLDERDSAMELESPRGTMTMDDGREAVLSADIGHYDADAERMELTGSVRLELSDDYVVDTSFASIDIATSTASGSKPVVVSGNVGTVQAEGFRVTDGGQRILFLGRSRMVLDSEQLKTPE